MLDVFQSSWKKVALVLAAAFGVLVAGTAEELFNDVDLNVTPGSESEPVLRVYGDDTNDGLAYSTYGPIAFGDVNGDGYDDLIAGAPYAQSTAGEVYVVYGKQSLPATTVDLSLGPGTFAETRIHGNHPGDHAGEALASGNVNNDGFDDIIIAVPGGRKYVDTAGYPAGEVFVVFGRANLASSEIHLSDAPLSNGESRIYLRPFKGDDQSISVASGDIDGDDYDDVIIGEPSYNYGAADSGLTWVIYGDPNFGPQEIDLWTNLDGYDATRIGGESESQYAGIVSSGDVSGDGYDDVVIGAPGGDPGGRQDAGEVFLLRGSDTIRDSTPMISALSAIYGGMPGDSLGYSTAIGDINADGFDDIVAGAPLAARGKTHSFILAGSCRVWACGVQPSVTQWPTEASGGAGPVL